MKITRLTINNSTSLDISGLSAKAQAELLVLLTDVSQLNSTYEKVGTEWTDAYYLKPVDLGLRTEDLVIHADYDAAKAHLASLAEVVEKAQALAEAA